MNYNYITKESYTNGNNDTLEKSKSDNGFKSDYWLTYLQAKDKGIKIKRDSKGTQIQIPVFDKEDKEKETPIYFKKVYLFNLDQTEEATSPDPEKPKARDFSKAYKAFGHKNDKPEEKTTPAASVERKTIILSDLKFELK